MAKSWRYNHARSLERYRSIARQLQKEADQARASASVCIVPQAVLWTLSRIEEAARELFLRVPYMRHTVQDNAPGTYGELSVTPRIVWSGASNDTIWGSAPRNYVLRAHHDSIHLLLNKGFSFTEEVEVTLEGLRRLRLQASPNLADVYWADNVGQQLYFYEKGQFPVEQKPAILDYLLSTLTGTHSTKGA